LASAEIFRAYDIRGVFGREFKVEDALDVGRGFATFLKNDGKTLVVGRDARLSSPLISKAVIAGMLSCGKDVVDVGILSTPALCFSTAKFGNACGGMMISASHNPPEYNGFKTKKKDGCGLVGEELSRLYGIIRSRKFSEVTDFRECGRYCREDSANEEFTDYMVSRVKPSRKFRVVIDVVNGTGGAAVAAMKRLGHEVIALNGELDGTFPSHAPEPRPDTIGQLVSEVQKQHADFGVCLDGDADRGVFVDDLGRVVRADAMTAILARHYLSEKPGGKIIATVNFSQHMERFVKDLGGKLIWSRVGSVFVDSLFKEEKALVGGEGSSHTWLHDFYPFSDGQHVILKATEVLRDIPLSRLVDDLNFGTLVSRRIHCPEPLKDQVMEEILEEFQKRHGKLMTLDGVKLVFDDRDSWVLIRRSNTEPILNLVAEAPTEKDAVHLADDYENEVARMIISRND